MGQAVNTDQIRYSGNKAGKCHVDINLIRQGRVITAHEIDGYQHNQQNKCYDIIIKDIFHDKPPQSIVYRFILSQNEGEVKTIA